MVDVFAVQHQAMNETLIAMGKEPWDLATAKERIGQPDNVQFPELFGDRADEALNIFRDANHRLNADKIKHDLMAGADQLLPFLSALHKKQHVYLGIISNKPSALIRKELAELGWENMIDVVVGSNDVEHNKPSPAAMEKALENFPHRDQLKKRDILYIGDTNSDVRFARNVGCRIIGVGDKITAPLKEEEAAIDLDSVLTRLQFLYQRAMPRSGTEKT